MDDLQERYDIQLAAAWILGHAVRTGVPALPASIVCKKASDCSEAECLRVVRAGCEAGLKLYPFKRSTHSLPRVRNVLGFLRSIQFETMLDVGSGRGIFLLPFLKEFPGVQVTSLDVRDDRVEFLGELACGGFPQLSALRGDVCEKLYPEGTFDVVCMLEVLEHIPQVEHAVEAAVCMASRHVVVSVPSKPDNNPEHIHLLTKGRLTDLFCAAGCDRLRFSGVNGHLIMVATVV